MASGGQYICAQCNKPITGSVTTAMGKTWHKEHFVCAHCKKPFNGAAFSVEDGQPYCIADHKKLFENQGNQASGGNPICAKCNKPITGTVTTAMGKTWHKEHFVCAHCKKPFNGAAFSVEDGQPYCIADHKKLFENQGNQASGGNPICAKCNKPITGTVTTAMGKSWHKEHFVCAHCKKPFNGASYYVNDDKPYCEADHKKLFQASGSQYICAQCNKPITGSVTTAMGKTWHKEHFVCAHCKKPFNGASYYVNDDKPYCEADHKKLFQASGSQYICAQCNKPITGTVTTAMGKTWHNEHFVCAQCKKPFNGAAYFVKDDKPYCVADHMKLFYNQGNHISGGSLICEQCNKPITDTVTFAMGKSWHKEHFVCAQCKKPFNGAAFYVNDGKPYCEADNKKLFQGQGNQESGDNPICAQCKKPITGTVTMAMGKSWHKDHFVCAHCKTPFNGAAFFVEDGQPYCVADYIKLFQDQGNQASGCNLICAQCNKPITDSVTMAMGKSWHKEHFVCAQCKKPFNGAAFYVHDDKPYCETDNKKLFQGQGNQDSGCNPICAQCNKPITDSVITAMGKTWHKEHFVCAHCKKPFYTSAYYVQDGKPYCDADHKKLFPTCHEPKPICAYCNKPISNVALKALGKSYHKDHFLCAQCKKPIHETSFKEHDGKPYCDKDYNALFRKRCSGCGQLIEGTVLTALQKDWHKQCFACSKCHKPISAKQGFTEKEGKPFCLACAV